MLERLILLVPALLAACTTAPVHRDVSPTVQLVVQTALAQVGNPYRYGGNSPGGFDCSGLVHYSYARAGISLPRSTVAQWEVTDELDRADLQPGDLLFFRLDEKIASHVALFIGDDRFVHAPSTGKQVEVSRLSLPYWDKRLVRLGRVQTLSGP